MNGMRQCNQLPPSVTLGRIHRYAISARCSLFPNPQALEGPLDSLYALARRIRKVESEAELSDIEDEIDNILKAQRARAASGDENAVDTTTLNIAAHRLEGLIHDRRGF
jgi:hypothetical protein